MTFLTWNLILHVSYMKLLMVKHKVLKQILAPYKDLVEESLLDRHFVLV